MELEPPFVLLEDRLTPGAQARLYRYPIETIRCARPQDLDAALARLEEALAGGLHAAGVLAYELGRLLEPRLSARVAGKCADMLLNVGLFGPPTLVTQDDLDRAFGSLPPPPPLTDIQLGHSREVHTGKVRRLLAHIAAGDIYQANLTFQIRFRYLGERLALYAALRTRQSTAHGGIVALDEDWALSVSPELFVRVTQGVAESRPMKGTAARGADDASDRAAAEELVTDPKQRAENTMIVDLIRNDLARIALPGSVQASRLLQVETYPTLHTLTSTVNARLRPGLGLRDQLTALFPCGSIVGAPKIKAMELLSAHEDQPRSLYTGAIGWFAPSGDMELNVAIRTAVVSENGVGTFGVGGGIVADSDPGGEYEEALLKARVLTGLADDFSLIETFRWSRNRGFGRLTLHLERLTASALRLGFVLDVELLQSDLDALSLVWACAERPPQRVRVQLSRDGGVRIEAEKLVNERSGPVRLGVSRVRLDKADPFLRHKTTRRAVYDAAAAGACAAGWDDALILNQAGEIADTTRRTVFLSVRGEIFTPPIESGALPGVLRQEVLAAGRVKTATLTIADLAQAQGLWVGNSLRGWREAVILA